MCFKIKEDGITISVKVIPNSSKNELFFSNDMLRLKITAPPVENKANKFVTEYFSKLFKVPKSSVSIIRGQTSKDKVIFISADNSTIKNIELRLSDICS